MDLKWVHGQMANMVLSMAADPMKQNNKMESCTDRPSAQRRCRTQGSPIIGQDNESGVGWTGEGFGKNLDGNILSGPQDHSLEVRYNDFITKATEYNDVMVKGIQ